MTDPTKRPEQKRCRKAGIIGQAKMRCRLTPKHDGKCLAYNATDECCPVDSCTNWRHHRGGLCMTHYSAAKEAGTLPERHDPTVLHPPAEWAGPIADWTVTLKLRDLSPQTIELRDRTLRRLSVDMGKSPWDVTLDDLTMWLGEPFAAGRWNGSMVRTQRSGVRSFYQWATKSGRITVDPSADLPQVPTPARNPKPVPEDDFRAAIATADPIVRMAVRLAGELGMRRAEVAQMHVDHIVDTDEGPVLRILGKGRKLRVLPLPDLLAATLRAHIAEHGIDGWAFPSNQGGHMTPHWLGTLVSRVLPAGYTMHKLRHRAATQAHRNSGDLLLVSEMLGHSSLATTQIYVAPDYSKLRGAIGDLSAERVVA